MNADNNNWHLTTIDSCQQLTLFNFMKYMQHYADFLNKVVFCIFYADNDHWALNVNKPMD